MATEATRHHINLRELAGTVLLLDGQVFFREREPDAAPFNPTRLT